MGTGLRGRSIGLVLVALIVLPLPAASADDGPSPVVDPLNATAIVDPPPSAQDAVVYDMYFPIQGGADFSNNFGDCRGGAGCPRTHEGIDIMQPKMTPILAVASGYVGWMHNEQGGDCCAFELNHDDGWESWYIHMNNDTPGTDDGQGWGFAPGVEPGARIEAGQLVGWVGDSGNAEDSGSHLHFELHKPGGIVINPYYSLQAATVLNAPLGTGRPRGCDFNGDGFNDLAVGTPGEDLANNRKADAGAVTVIYGGSGGLDGSGAQLITQASPGVGNVPEAGDEFGYATACGDIDNDGYDDLVVGVPGETVAARAGAGAINLIRGSAAGLTATGTNFWHQRLPGMATPAEAGDRFGETIAVGDFNNDGYADAAVGVPGETIAGRSAAGMVAVLYGSAAGFDGTSSAFNENTPGIAGAVEAGDTFGASLATGDFDNDGFVDLAIGIPGEDSATKKDSGAVVAIHGTGSGLEAAGSSRFTQNSAGVDGVALNNELFGTALASADFDGDDRADLAIGVPGDRSGGIVAGGVNVLYGGGSGLTAAGSVLLQQGIGGILGSSQAGDAFGAALTMGDFNADGKHDLAIGAPEKAVAGLAGAGSLAVVYGSDSGLSATGNEVWTQDTAGILNHAEAGDGLARWLRSGDFSGTGVSWLVVGVPFEDLVGREDVGLVHAIAGKAGVGLVPAGDQAWHQGDTGIPNTNESGDGFGHLGPTGGT